MVPPTKLFLPNQKKCLPMFPNFAPCLKKSYAGNTGEEIKSLLSKYFINEKFKKENYFSINEIRGKLFFITTKKQQAN
jgi:hypothetical protein